MLNVNFMNASRYGWIMAQNIWGDSRSVGRAVVYEVVVPFPLPMGHLLVEVSVDKTQKPCRGTDMCCLTTSMSISLLTASQEGYDTYFIGHISRLISTENSMAFTN